MAFTVIIPARYGSTRLPGKALADIGGLPMVQRVWQQARASSAERVVIATDDQRIVDTARGFGAEVCLTRPSHPTGTDRLQEVAAELGFSDDHIIVNVQGDEPLIPPAVIDQVARGLASNAGADIATLCESIDDAETLRDPNAVKVVANGEGMALYFSRAPIPWPREAFVNTPANTPSNTLSNTPAGSAPEPMPPGDAWFRHIGIYAYRTRFLHRYVTWPPAPLEQLEQLEQLRALYHGVQIHVEVAEAPVPGGVDTPADLERMRRVFAGGRA